MRLRIRPDRCAGTGLCALAAPDVFDQDDDAVVLLRQESPPEADRAAVARAVLACPTEALLVED